MHRVTRAVSVALSSACSSSAPTASSTAGAATGSTTPSLLRTAAPSARSQQRRDYTATEMRDSCGVRTVTCRTGLTASEEARTPENELLSAALAECVAAVDEARRFTPSEHPYPWGATWTSTCRTPGTEGQMGAAAAAAAATATTGGKKKQKAAKKQRAADDAMAAAVAAAAASASTRAPALVVMAHTHHGKGAVGKRFVETLQDEATVPGWVAERLVGCSMHESGCPSIKTEAGEVLDTQVMLTALFLPEGAEYETTLAHRTSDGVPALPTGRHTLPNLPLREMRETLTPLVVGFSNAPASDASFTKTQALFPRSLVAMEHSAEGAAGQAGAAAAAPPGVYARRGVHEEGHVCAAVYVRSLDVAEAAAFLELAHVGLVGRGMTIFTEALQEELLVPKVMPQTVTRVPLVSMSSEEEMMLPTMRGEEEAPYKQTTRVVGLNEVEAQNSALCALCNYPLAPWTRLVDARDCGSGRQELWAGVPHRIADVPTTPSGGKRTKTVRAHMLSPSSDSNEQHLLFTDYVDARAARISREVLPGFTSKDLLCPSCSGCVGHRHTSRQRRGPQVSVVTLFSHSIATNIVPPAKGPRTLIGAGDADAKAEAEGGGASKKGAKKAGAAAGEKKKAKKKVQTPRLLAGMKNDRCPEDFFNNKVPLAVFREGNVGEVKVMPGQCVIIGLREGVHLKLLKDALNCGKTPYFGFVQDAGEGEHDCGTLVKVLKVGYWWGEGVVGFVAVQGVARIRLDPTFPAEVIGCVPHHRVTKLEDDDATPHAKKIVDHALAFAATMPSTFMASRLAKLKPSKLTAAQLEALSFELMARLSKQQLMRRRHFIHSTDTLKRVMSTPTSGHDGE